MSLLGKKGRPGWDTAPPEVELEIRGVWQEDEMPDEIKNGPGYRPFTLGVDAQTWVDSMEEVVDGGDTVYGRPRAALPRPHRSLTSPSVSPPPVPYQVTPSPAPMAPPIFGARVIRYTSRTSMPDIDDPQPTPVAPQRSLPRRVMMPDIGDDVKPLPAKPRPSMPDFASSTNATPAHRSMPDIDDESTPGRARDTVPDVGADTPGASRRPAMPDIAGDTAHFTATHQPIPDIGDDEDLSQRRAIPDVGDDEKSTKPPHPPMPDIG